MKKIEPCEKSITGKHLLKDYTISWKSIEPYGTFMYDKVLICIFCNKFDAINEEGK